MRVDVAHKGRPWMGPFADKYFTSISSLELNHRTSHLPLPSLVRCIEKPDRVSFQRMQPSARASRPTSIPIV
jgi:hypothetical protein